MNIALELLVGVIFGILIPMSLAAFTYIISHRLRLMSLMLGMFMMLGAIDYYRHIGYLPSWIFILLLIIIAGGYGYYITRFISGD